MKMYRVSIEWLGAASIHEMDVQKVTEKTVLTDKGSRYFKKCNSYEVFDSKDPAKKCAVKYNEEHITSLQRQLHDARIALSNAENY